MLWLEFKSFLSRPRIVAIEGGALRFDYPDPITRRSAPKTLWRKFLELKGKPDASIGDFAQRYGPLFGDPVHASIVPDMVYIWRLHIDDLTEMHSGLEQLKKGGPADWKRVREIAGFRRTEQGEAPAPDTPAMRISMAVNAVHQHIQALNPFWRLSFGYEDSRFQMKLGTESVWVTVMVQMAHHYLGQSKPVACTGCGKPLKARRHSGKRQFCEQCRESGIPMRLVMRRRYKRLKKLNKLKSAS